MIERGRDLLGRLIVERPQIRPLDIISVYQGVNGCVPENIRRIIMLYPNWRYEILTQAEVGNLIWYFDYKNPNHISWLLTNDGKSRRVKQVAEICLSIGLDSLVERWNEALKIEEMIQALKKGENLPPLIIVKGSHYPDSPDSSFIDGVHRSLAISMYSLTTADANLEIEAFVGQKANLLKRFIRRVS